MAPSSRYRRRELCQNVATGTALHYYPLPLRAKVITKRLSLAVNLKLREEQAGFRRGRCSIDNIFTLRNIIEQCSEWQRCFYVSFVDFAKPFDSVHRDSLERMESPLASSRSSEASTTTLPVVLVLVMVTSCSKFTLVLDKCPHCFSILL